jgi:hypothetical protein
LTRRRACARGGRRTSRSSRYLLRTSKTLSGFGASTTQPWIPPAKWLVRYLDSPDTDSLRSRARPWRQGLPHRHRRTMDAHRGLCVKCDARSLRFPGRLGRRGERITARFQSRYSSQVPKNGAPCHPGRLSPNSVPFTSRAIRRLVCSPRQPPAADLPPVSFTYDPHDPTPTVGGPRMVRSGRVDDSVYDSWSDVLVYISGPLKKDVEVIGKPVIQLAHSTDVLMRIRLSEVMPTACRTISLRIGKH